MSKHLKSLREYLDALTDIDDVRVIDAEVSPELEAGAIFRCSVEEHAPAPLLTRLRGHEPGFRLLGGPGALSSRPDAPYARVALSLGLAPTVHPLQIVDAVAAARPLTGVPPVVVDDGPCQQNVLLGENAGLARFPIPLIHDGDGGRYANTWGAIVVRTPDGSWTNWSIARVMKRDDRTLVGMVRGGQDIGRIHRLWRERGEDMPYALVQGAEPAVPFVCGMGLPAGVDEGAFLGAYFGEPLEVVRCRTVDLEVPATAEVVIEGRVSISEVDDEGPMGEYAGYLSGGSQRWPVFSVSAITYRDDPIWPVVSAGKPVEEDHTVVGVMNSADALYQLRSLGLPVTALWVVPESAVNLVVVTVPRDWRERTPYTSTRMITQAIAQAILRIKLGFWVTRILVTDDDIDPTDLRDVMWAFGTRCHPVRGQIVLPEQRVTPLHLFYSPAEQRGEVGGEKMAYDALFDPDPARRPRSTAFRENFTAEVQNRVRTLLAD